MSVAASRIAFSQQAAIGPFFNQPMKSFSCVAFTSTTRGEAKILLFLSIPYKIILL